MKIPELLDGATRPLTSFELIPPRRGGSLQEIMSLVEELAAFQPPFIDVTSHSAEVWYEELPDGSIRRHVKKKRPGTLGLCAAIQTRFGVEAVPHLLCQGFSREETEDALIELNYLGIRNVMALRGDASTMSRPQRTDRTANQFAGDLVRQVGDMNRGVYLGDAVHGEPTSFCVGVAGYPEKHFEAPSLRKDIEHLKRKVDAGASWIVTQMFFDNAKYFAFVDRCREAGITVPIVPGLKILTNARQLQSLPASFHIDLPDDLVDEVSSARPEQVPEIGVRWAIRQGEELRNRGVPCLHFYIMQTSKHVAQVLRHLSA